MKVHTHTSKMIAGMRKPTEPIKMIISLSVTGHVWTVLVKALNIV